MTPVEMAEEAAKQLEGTCKSIADLGEEFEDLQNDSQFCARLDELIFECTQCNWWHEQDEMSEDQDWICQECADAI